MIRSAIAVAAVASLLSGCAKETNLDLDCVMTKDPYQRPDMSKVGKRQIFRLSLEDFRITNSAGCDFSNSVTEAMIVNSLSCREPANHKECLYGGDTTISLNRFTGTLKYADQCIRRDGLLGGASVTEYQCEKASKKF